MKVTGAVFVKSAIRPKDFPAEKLPEFAFFGRSNVGKSSLINMLAGKKGLVKTGSTPGVTQTINFFRINNSCHFVDLPGLGFAKAPKEVKDTFYPMILNYLTSKRDLRIAFLLVDCRRTPGDYEEEIIAMLAEAHIPTALVATKCDKLSKSKLAVQLTKIAKILNVDKADIFMTSAKSGAGKKELLGIAGRYLQVTNQQTP